MDKRDDRSLELFNENLNLKSENTSLKAEVERLEKHYDNFPPSKKLIESEEKK